MNVYKNNRQVLCNFAMGLSTHMKTLMICVHNVLYMTSITVYKINGKQATAHAHDAHANIHAHDAHANIHVHEPIAICVHDHCQCMPKVMQVLHGMRQLSKNLS